MKTILLLLSMSTFALDGSVNDLPESEWSKVISEFRTENADIEGIMDMDYEVVKTLVYDCEECFIEAATNYHGNHYANEVYFKTITADSL